MNGVNARRRSPNNLTVKEVVVGCAFPSKKAETMKKTLETKASSISWVLIDLDALGRGEPLEAQGKFDVVLHKLSEDIHNTHGGACDETSLGRSKARLRSLEAYCSARSVPLLDSPSAVARVVSRGTTCTLLAALAGTPLTPTSLLRAPRFVIAPQGVTAATAVEVEAALAAQGIPLAPLIGKPVTACGPGSSHLLTIFLDRPAALCSAERGAVGAAVGAGVSWTEEAGAEGAGGRADIASLRSATVVQEYVNHDGVLLKVYVIGDEVRRVACLRRGHRGLTASRFSVPVGAVLHAGLAPKPADAPRARRAWGRAGGVLRQPKGLPLPRGALPRRRRPAHRRPGCDLANRRCPSRGSKGAHLMPAFRCL